MTDDILDRLRDPLYAPWQFPRDAAAEIERLRSEVERLRTLLTEWADAGDRWIARGIEPGRSLEDLHRLIRDSAIATAALRAEVGR